MPVRALIGLTAGALLLALPVAAQATPAHYAGVELGQYGSPLVFTVDGPRVSSLVYVGTGYNCPGVEDLRVALVGYKLPQTGARQGNSIDLVYEDNGSRIELAGTLNGRTASGTMRGTANGCDLGERQWRAVADGPGATAGRRKPKAPRGGRWVGTDASGHAAVSFIMRRGNMSDVRIVSYLTCSDGDNPLNLTSFQMRPTLKLKVTDGKFFGALIPGANFDVFGIYNFDLTIKGHFKRDRAKAGATLALGRRYSPPTCHGKPSFTAQPLP